MPTLVNTRSARPGTHEGIIQTFSLRAPGAASVQLVGDFTRWQRAPINLRKDADNVWRTRLELKPGLHRYRFLVDGKWFDDPACPFRLANPFGSQDDVRQVA